MKENRKNTPNVPNLRFPEFEGEWKIKTLENHTAKIGDGIHGTPKYDDNGEYYFINGNNLVDGNIKINEQTKRVSDDEAIKHKRDLGSHTLLLSINGTVGNVAFYKEEKVMLGKSAAYLNIEAYIDVNFIYHVLNTPKTQYFFYSELTGTTIKNLSLKSIRETRIALPILEEQTKIADFLQKIDKRIDTQSKIIEDYKFLKKGLMQKIFNQELRFKDNQGNLYADWSEKKLGEVLKIGSGKDYKHLKSGNIPVYGTGGYMTSVDDYLFEGKSVGIGRKGTIDKPVFLDGKFWTVDTLFYTHSFDGVTPYFAYLLFQRINWLKFNEASGVPSLSKATIEKIKVRIPEIAEQQKISSMLSAIDEKIVVESKQLENLKTQKQYLLQNLFV
ncbi:restriction endonuclease subunit S [Carboxylicivirga linearis]|uniref:Restriction endonuclease subunit S n=1 Tax=Carboxylicivirga linearis TaxID=1628157 RepID=A0ABS5K1A4_9BACT|nr:restriction endonuclease subunit S [Carboxylicivirga linearis]MBS2100938.1 restriction endonuclease subunit S [Carboxylicivirga linearis]